MLSGRKKINTSISKNVTYIQLTNKTSLQTKSNKPTDREFIRIVGGKNENTLPNRIGVVAVHTEQKCIENMKQRQQE